MAQRTVALCNGKYIGIESIYTVINGQQINIPEKLKELRAKSRNDELFCPCGCGTNLILVAGDRNLREQHFREKTGTGKYECTMPIEGKTSIDSKIVLKCWLDEKIQASDIESRVPIDTIEDIKRKPEFSFLSMEKKIGIRYWRTRTNILDDRINILTDNMSGIKVFYIVDLYSGGTEGQYPEALMKIQDKQQYCLLLEIQGSEYDKAKLQAVFYEKDIDGFWRKNIVAEGKLSAFSISDNNELLYLDQDIENLLRKARTSFVTRQETEKQRRDEAEKGRQEKNRIYLEQEKKRQEERKRIFEESEKQLQEQKEKREKQRKEAKEIEREANEMDEEIFKRIMESIISQQDTPVRDVDGRRLVKCEFCGKIATDDEFIDYGGANHVNLGTCKDCSRNNPEASKSNISFPFKKEYDPMKCPECGGRLKERKGKYGLFYGCSNFPKCKYTRTIRKK